MHLIFTQDHVKNMIHVSCQWTALGRHLCPALSSMQGRAVSQMSHCLTQAAAPVILAEVRNTLNFVTIS